MLAFFFFWLLCWCQKVVNLKRQLFLGEENIGYGGNSDRVFIRGCQIKVFGKSLKGDLVEGTGSLSRIMKSIFFLRPPASLFFRLQQGNDPADRPTIARPFIHSEFLRKNNFPNGLDNASYESLRLS